ncbi:MAG: terminase [Steroidobacteraceae bacterium]
MTVRNLEPNSEAPAINASDLRGRQLQGYARYHQSRLNLLLHIVLVPLFLAGNVALLVALLEGRWTLAIGALVSTVLSIAIQGRAHSGEPVPPEPFTSPGNAVARILLEQWVTFPRFVLSGGWSRALRRRST